MPFTGKPLQKRERLLLKAVKELLADADAADEKKVEAEKDAIHEYCREASIHTIFPWKDGTEMLLDEKFNSPESGKNLYKPCLACGTCTFVCPTCQCYDIKDYDTGHGIKRYRCWDSCMYSDFTMMAHGNNRTSQMQRFRQRFMHKLGLFPGKQRRHVFLCRLRPLCGKMPVIPEYREGYQGL